MGSGLIEVEFDKGDLKRLQATLAAYPRKVPQVMSRAINKTATTQRAKIIREIARVSGMKQKDVRVRIRIQRATFTQWVAEINIGNRGIALIRFKARQTKKGVTFKNPKTGQRELKPSAFVATMSNGHRGVFVREGKKRLPIFEQFGPGISEIFEHAGLVARSIIGETQVILEKFIGQQVDLVFERAARRAAG